MKFVNVTHFSLWTSTSKYQTLFSNFFGIFHWVYISFINDIPGIPCCLFSQEAGSISMEVIRFAPCNLESSKRMDSSRYLDKASNHRLGSLLEEPWDLWGVIFAGGSLGKYIISGKAQTIGKYQGKWGECYICHVYPPPAQDASHQDYIDATRMALHLSVLPT